MFLKLSTAKRLAVIIASKYLAETASLDDRVSSGTKKAAKDALRLTTILKTSDESTLDNKQFEDLVMQTIDSGITLANSVEGDIRAVIPAGSAIFDEDGKGDKLCAFYASLAIALADMYPGRMPIPPHLSPDDFYGIIVANRNNLLKLGGTEYRNK